MAIDFNQAEEQGSGAGAIPPDSVVMVTAHIRAPKEGGGKEGTVNPLFCKANSGFEYLNFEFEVISTRFRDRKLWQNFMLAYTKTPTEKSNQAISISMRTLRAMVEAGRGVSPKDSSPEATQKRIINDFSDLDGMMFPVVVGCEWSPKNAEGRRYLNNTIKRIVTPDDDRFEKVWKNDSEGLIDSGKPLPPEPGETATEAGSKPSWAAPKADAPVPQGTLPGTKPEKPAWMK